MYQIPTTNEIELKKSSPYYYNKKAKRYLSKTKSGNREHYFEVLSKIADPLYFDANSTYGKFVLKKIKPQLKEYKIYSSKLTILKHELKIQLDKEIELFIREKEKSFRANREIKTAENAKSSDLYKLVAFLSKYSFILCIITGVSLGYKHNDIDHFVNLLLLGIILFPAFTSMENKLFNSFRDKGQLKQDNLKLEAYKKKISETLNEKYAQNDTINELEILLDHKIKQIQKQIFTDYKNEKLRFILSDQFYNSIEWRNLRDTILKIEPKRCRICLNTNNLEVDHIKPRSKYPELALEKSNLQILCRTCNRIKSNK